MKWYKSSWVRTTHINPWGINLGFATILLCIYNELLLPHSRSSNTFKRKENKRAVCPPNELVGGEKGVHGSESNRFPSPSSELWNPLEEGRSQASVEHVGFFFSFHCTASQIMWNQSPWSKITRNDFSSINHCYHSTGQGMLWFFSSKTFQASGFMSWFYFFPSQNQLHAIDTINLSLLPGDRRQWHFSKLLSVQHLRLSPVLRET